MEVADQAAPHACEVGFVHGDLSEENVVVTTSGNVSVVDNETYSIDAYDYDLGRTWYRWPMTASEGQAFVAGYRRYRQAHAFAQHFAFWALCAVTDGAVFRLNVGPEATAVPLARLRTLLAGAGRDSFAPRQCSKVATIANERLKRNRAGQVVLQLKSAFKDGTTHIVMSPLEFMQRLATRVPRPRLHLPWRARAERKAAS